MVSTLSNRCLAAAFLLLLAWAWLPAGVGASPIAGELISERQPDGTLVSYRAWGDEFYAFAESPDGYTLTRQPDGWICYAALAGGDLVSTGIHYGGKGASQKVTATGLKPHLRLSSQAVAGKVAASAAELLGPDLAALEAGKPTPLRAISTGNPRGIVLLVDFSDYPSTIPATDFDAFFNQPGYKGYGNNGSVRDYFYDVSGGKLTYTNTVPTSYYRALKPRSYYDDPNATYDTRACELVTEALNDLDAKGFDFSQYDYDNNGIVDAINVLYAGPMPGVWYKGLTPHTSSKLNLTFDGKKCKTFQISYISSSLTLGTICHENGHMLLGFPDLSDTGGESFGAGSYCLMGYGLYNGGALNPAALCAYMKARAGWVNLISLNSPGVNLPAVAAGAAIYKFSHPTRANEYFLVENRNKSIPRDAPLYAQGLAVWHIDENGSNNNDAMTPASHYLVSLVQADGHFDLEHCINPSDSTDLFDSTRNHVGPFTRPNTDWWDGTHSYLDLHNISAAGLTMTFCAGDNDVLSMSMAADLAAVGPAGGPFTSATMTYTIQNASTQTLSWSAQADVPWLALSGFGTSGVLIGAGDRMPLGVALSPAAASLAPGAYTGTITVTDLTTHFALKRQARLRISDRALVARWPLDETAGPTARDAALHGFDGTLKGAAAWTTSTARGLPGGGLALDGVSANYVDLPPLNINRNMATITAWVRRNGTQKKSTGIALWRGGTTVAGLHFGNANELRYHWNDAKPTYNFDSGLIVPDAQWCFTALVIEPSRATLYLHDGTTMSLAVNNYPNDLEEFNGAGSLGRDSYNTSRTLAGMLRDVRVYNYPLTPAELDVVRLSGGRAENPSPPDGARGLFIFPELRWLPVSGATGHNIYLGTTPNLGSQPTISAWPGPNISLMCNPLTTYYWRVDEITPTGIVPGAVWQFTTGPATDRLPQAYWPLDDGTGTLVREYVAGNNGTTAGTTWTLNAKFEGGLMINGTTGTLTLPRPNLNTDQMTFTAWLKLNAPAKRRAGILTWGSAVYPAGLIFSGAYELGYYWPGANSSDTFFSGLHLPVGSWSFVALSIWNSGATLYLHDGDKLTSVTNVAPHSTWSSLTGPGWIGHNSLTSPGVGFDGEVDEVRVYGLALTQDEILAAMSNCRTAAPFAATTPQPANNSIALWAPADPLFSLHWSPGTRARQHDIYFGTTYPPPYLTSTLGTVWVPPTPTNGAYYWRINEVNSAGTSWGTTWSFTTRPNAIPGAWQKY